MFLKATEDSYGPRTAKSLAGFFNNLGLPAPNSRSQFTYTADGGYIIFNTAAACVIRITPNRDFPRFDHPLILQPLLSKNLGPVRAEILPGIYSPAGEPDADWLVDKLAEDNISFFDQEVENTGYLPYKTDEHPDGLPVVIDVAACELLTESIETTKDYLRDAIDMQQMLFGDLYDIFGKAWKPGEEESDPLKMKEAWDRCALRKSRGILVDNWNTDRLKQGFKNAKDGAAAYGALMKNHKQLVL